MIAIRMRKTAFKSAWKAAAVGTTFIVSRPMDRIVHAA